MRSDLRMCGCGAALVAVAGGGRGLAAALFMCFRCDAPTGSAGFPQGFDPPTWEINQRRRERGEFA